MDASPPIRGALLLSGHLRDTCRDDQVRLGLLEEVRLCRSTFRGACDIFLHSWDVMESADSNAAAGSTNVATAASTSSFLCLQELAQAITFAAVTIEKQRLPTDSDVFENTALAGTSTWGTSGRSTHGFYMNLMGQVGALELMQRHADAMRLHYAAAVRMRVDWASPRVAALTRARPPWSTIYRRARASPQRSDEAVVHACSHNRSLGSPASDNCYWSAPTRWMAQLILPFSQAGTFEARSTATNRSCLKAAHPESLLRCALGQSGVVGRPSPGEEDGLD